VTLSLAAQASQTPAPTRSGELSNALALSIPFELVDSLARRVVELLTESGTFGAAPPPWLDVDQAAAYLACSRQRIYDLVSAGTLRPARDGRRVLFRREWLDEYVGGCHAVATRSASPHSERLRGASAGLATRPSGGPT
jgi:excisionase family DNA binding protein